MEENLIWMSQSSQNEKAMSSGGEVNDIEVVGNHVYFYNNILFETALTLNKTLQDLSVKLATSAKAIGVDRPVIHLHINSQGGVLHAGVSIMDTIERLKKEVDIYTYVEGLSASAATFISCVGTKRFITKNSHMMIHQLRAGAWGKYNEIKDKMDSLDTLMEMIKRVYKQNTKVAMKDLDKILEHDLYWDAKKSLQNGLIDEII